MQTRTRFPTKSFALLLAGASATAVAPAAAQHVGGPALGGFDLASCGSRAFTYITGALTPAAVPEPSTYALLATGIAGLAGALVRRRHSAV